jgi:hypothetical protein
MGSLDGDSGSLDLIVRGGAPTTTLMVSGHGSPEQHFELRGMLSDVEHPGYEQRIVLVLSPSDVSPLSFSEPENGEVSIYYGKRETAAHIAAFSATPAINERYMIYSGLIDNGAGEAVDYIAALDPLPAFLVGAAVLVGACVVMGGVALATQKLEAASSGFKQACKERGGFTIATPEFGFEFSPAEGKFGCLFTPRLQCVGLDGEPVSVG